MIRTGAQYRDSIPDGLQVYLADQQAERDFCAQAVNSILHFLAVVTLSAAWSQGFSP